jgi:putative hydrolases of HD superfamily
MTTNNASFQQAIDFIAYADQLKRVIRRNGLFDGSRRENTAEHSWHAALSAQMLAPFANEPVDADRVTKMLMIHDLIEIEAGDTYAYDMEARAKQEAVEAEAAEVVFGRMPEPKGLELRALWDEFEARETHDAKFAKAIDRFMPLYSNYHNGGFSWSTVKVSRQQIVDVCWIIQEGSQRLWTLAEQMLDNAVNKGWINP